MPPGYCHRPLSAGLGIRSFDLCTLHSFALRSFALCSFSLRSFALHSFPTLCCSSLLHSLLFCSSLFHSMLFCSKLLSLHVHKEWLWAICSRCSLKKSNNEQIPYIALYKRVTRGNRSLTNSDVSDFIVFWEWITLWLFRFQKTCNSLKKFIVFTMSLTVFHCFSPFYAQGRQVTL